MKNKSNGTYQKKQRGMTLVEIIAALAIVAAVIVGALALFDNASSSQRAVQFYSDVQGLRVAAQQMYSGVGTYSGLTNATLIAANKVPANLGVEKTANTIRSPFNGLVTVRPAGDNKMTIEAAGIPFDACTLLLLATNAAWESVTVGGTLINSFPINPETANTNCGDRGAFRTITWTSAN